MEPLAGWTLRGLRPRDRAGAIGAMRRAIDVIRVTGDVVHGDEGAGDRSHEASGQLRRLRQVVSVELLDVLRVALRAIAEPLDVVRVRRRALAASLRVLQVRRRRPALAERVDVPRVRALARAEMLDILLRVRRLRALPEEGLLPQDILGQGEVVLRGLRGVGAGPGRRGPEGRRRGRHDLCRDGLRNGLLVLAEPRDLQVLQVEVRLRAGLLEVRL
mmetsp:Transcript_24759/g.65424  ORF Transcript_24759/g.65424 Transcript_24759/m.65424 type:complete len:217 (+) Transcript_24759:649-1299(+)